MVLAHLNYRDVNCNEVTWKEWQELINADQRYCNELKYRKPLKRVSMVNLPSWHPYWQYQVKKNGLERVKELRAIYAKCRENRSLIKVYFGNTANLATIKKKIAEKLKAIA